MHLTWLSLSLVNLTLLCVTDASDFALCVADALTFTVFVTDAFDFALCITYAFDFALCIIDTLTFTVCVTDAFKFALCITDAFDIAPCVTVIRKAFTQLSPHAIRCWIRTLDFRIISCLFYQMRHCLCQLGSLVCQGSLTEGEGSVRLTYIVRYLVLKERKSF